MLTRLLRQFLFTLVHLLLGLLVALQNVYQVWAKRSWSYKEEMTRSDVQMIREIVPRLDKKLKHIVVAVEGGGLTLGELARLVIWSLITGVPYISFHDVTGELKENEEKLFLEIERHKKGIPGCIKWSNKPDLNGYSNGVQANTIIVNILSPEDGRTKIAHCVREIAKGNIPCERSSELFTAQELDQALSYVYPPVPDPDVLLYIGPLCTTNGLLPWHIRLTEFIQLSPHHRICVQDYVGALVKYSKCDQRFGK